MLAILAPHEVPPSTADRAVNLLPASGEPTQDVLDDIGFYVAPYLGALSTVALIERMPRLEVVQLLTAGFDHALPYLPAGVRLCNAAGVHNASTAELAVGLTLASLRNIDGFVRAMPNGEWLFGRHPALADKRVGVVGAGGIGQAIAARLTPFEVDVTMFARTARQGIRAISELADALPQLDVVILAVPLTHETEHLVDAAFLARMRDGALLVNVARGRVVDATALLDALRGGRISAALDVTDPEPLPRDHPLWGAPNVIISPHVGGNSSAFLPRAQRLVDAQVGRWIAGEALEYVVAG